MARQKSSLKYAVGDLVAYTLYRDLEPDSVNYFAPYWQIRLQYNRPTFLEECNNFGLITQCHTSFEMFFERNKKNNLYIWCSQQTGKEYIVFEDELTAADECGKIGDYANSFIGLPFKKQD